jgi:acyl dehydratase
MSATGYKVDVNEALGHRFPPQKVMYNRRDLILYALGVGIPETDLKYLYELHPSFSALPFYPLVLPFKGTSSDIVNFAASQTNSSTPGIPPFDLNKLVHGEQSLELLRPIPVEGEFVFQNVVTGIYDKGSGFVIEKAGIMIDQSGKEYVKLSSQSFVRGYGGWGGPKGPKSPSYAPPKRAPDIIISFKTSAAQAQVYRLSGDYNPLHIDPSIGKKVGFPGPILHGLCSFGISAQLMLKAVGSNEPSLFKKITARFASPVFLGETLEVHSWHAPEHSNGQEDAYIFVTKVKERDTIVINNALFVVRKAGAISKL